MDIKAISCPQCGSTDVEMTSDNRGKCHMCGSMFQIETQTPAEETATDTCQKASILAEHSKSDFLRKVWITLAKENAPIEVFSADFDEVRTDKHEVLVETISAFVNYQASIGYDREEQYVDIETYYDKEPYQDTEDYYENGVKKQRMVTKYRKVEKQRQVTKTRTVTDWSPNSGLHRADHTAIEENIEDVEIFEDLFIDSFRTAAEQSIVPITGDEADRMEITAATRERVKKEHTAAVEDSLERSLPGDHWRDLSWDTVAASILSASLYRTVEYSAEINYNGRTYIKRAFPFGSMQVGGDSIKNEVSPEAFADKMNVELKKTISDRNKAIDKAALQKVYVPALVTIALLVLSIIISWKVHVTALVVIFFIAAVAAFIYNLKLMKKAEAEETSKAEEDNRAEEARVKAEIRDYKKNFKEKQLEALGQKLAALGLAPATEDEL